MDKDERTVRWRRETVYGLDGALEWRRFQDEQPAQAVIPLLQGAGGDYLREASNGDV